MLDPNEKDILIAALVLPALCLIVLAIWYAMVETWYRAGDPGIALLGGYAAIAAVVLWAMRRRRK